MWLTKHGECYFLINPIHGFGLRKWETSQTTRDLRLNRRTQMEIHKSKPWNLYCIARVDKEPLTYSCVRISCLRKNAGKISHSCNENYEHIQLEDIALVPGKYYSEIFHTFTTHVCMTFGLNTENFISLTSTFTVRLCFNNSNPNCTPKALHLWPSVSKLFSKEAHTQSLPQKI